MKTTRQHLLVILNIGVSLTLIGTLAGLIARQDKWDNSVNASNSELSADKSDNNTLEGYIKENDRLKQELAAARQSVADCKQYADNLSAKVVYVPEYHEQTTVKEVEVDKPVYVNNEWREFESAAKLMEWSEEHLAVIWIVGDQVADCDDYAARLQREAFKDGYLLSLQVISGGMLNGKNVSNYTALHMGNLAMVGNDIYFIEPQPEYFRIVFVCHRD